MNSRERLLIWVATGITVTGLLYLLYAKLLLWPAQANNTSARQIVMQIEKLRQDIALEPHYRLALRESMRKDYGPDEMLASEMSRAHLVSLIRDCGLNSDDQTMTPITGGRINGAKEIGWAVTAKGPINRLVDFLYLLHRDDHLHQLTNVTWTPDPNDRDATLSFRFVTLVLEPVGEQAPLITVAEMKPLLESAASIFTSVGLKTAAEAASFEKLDKSIVAARTALNEQQDPKPDTRRLLAMLKEAPRGEYALIAERDLFRPYVKKPPPPPPVVRNDQPRNETPPTPPAPSFERYRLVGLPAWNGHSDVVVRDTDEQTTRIYKVGEDLLGGEIVAVDYRPLPRPDKPDLLSFSRVIVRIGNGYWAVEIGHTLQQKYRMKTEQLPPALREQDAALNTRPKSQPGSNRDTTAPSGVRGAQPTDVEATAVSKETTDAK